MVSFVAGTVVGKIHGLDELSSFSMKDHVTRADESRFPPSQHSLVRLSAGWDIFIRALSILLITNYEQAIMLVLSIFIDELKRLTFI